MHLFESLRGWVSISVLVPLLVAGCGAPDLEEDLPEVGSLQEELRCSSADREHAVDLGVLDPGQFYSAGRGINNRGTVVGVSDAEHAPGSNPARAFRWTAETGMVALDPLGGSSSRAQDVNDRDQVVGSVDFSDGSSHAVMWDADGTGHDLGTLGGRYSSAEAINNRGEVVGVSVDGSGRYRAFIWSEREGMVDLGLPTGDFGQPNDINDAGVVVGRIQRGDSVFPFKWTSKHGPSALDLMGGTDGDASSVNRHGDIVGYGIIDGWFAALKWAGRRSSPVVLKTIEGGVQPWPHAINDRGTIVGWDWPADRDMAAVEWTSPSHVRLLPLEPAGRAYDINDRGQVVGDWNWHAYILEPGKRRCKRH